MKKIISLLATVLAVCALLTVCAFADSSVEGTTDLFAKFFPDGKIGKISDVYFRTETGNKSGNSDKPESIYMWFTQPDDLMAMFKERREAEDIDAWYAEYGVSDITYSIQLDCKLDDGPYRYCEEWEYDEYQSDAPDWPYDWVYSPRHGVDDSQKTYTMGSSCIDASHAEMGTGFLSPIIKGNSTAGYYLDLKEHSLTFRARYILQCRVPDPDGSEHNVYLCSDWSEDVVLGKNGTQEKLVKPEQIEAPILSDLTFLRSERNEDGTIVSEWKVKVDYPAACYEAMRYYVAEKNEFEPLCVYILYRVYKNGAWGEWADTYWGNATVLASGWKNFSTTGVEENDAIEFTAYIKNTAEMDMDSPRSISLFRNAEEIGETTPPATGPQDSGKIDNTPPTGKTKCKVCGICPVQPLGICLFIWLVIIVAILIAAWIVKNKLQKDSNGKR